MPAEESQALQSAMAKGWETVLIQRAVKKLAVLRSAWGRSVQVAQRSERLRNLLTPGIRFPERPVEPRDPTLRNRKRVWSRPEGSSDSDSSDEDLEMVDVRPLVEVTPEEEEEYEE